MIVEVTVCFVFKTSRQTIGVNFLLFCAYPIDSYLGLGWEFKLLFHIIRSVILNRSKVKGECWREWGVPHHVRIVVCLFKTVVWL